MIEKPKCPYFDEEYARTNEFDYSCSNPYEVHLNGDMGNVLSDDLFELCGGCLFFDYESTDGKWQNRDVI